MKSTIAYLIVLLISLPSHADQTRVMTATSPDTRVVFFELYTSEGCSSCPPADRFLSRPKQQNIDYKYLIPLAFHVTYWDYIGWRDRFGDSQYDERQRRQAKLAASRIVYTPQFMMNGRDYRRYNHFDTDIKEVLSMPAEYQLELSAVQNEHSIDVDVVTTPLNGNNDPVSVYLAVYEHGLSSEVTDGENEGKELQHDYVVRKLYGPFPVEAFPSRIMKMIKVENDWDLTKGGLVAFIQKPMYPDVLQAVHLGLHH